MNANRHIIEFLQALGEHTVGTDYRAWVEKWREWYVGDVADFHHYRVYNGVRQLSQTRRTLNMAKTVSEDWANLLLNERVRIAAEDGDDALQAILEANRFDVIGNHAVEMAFSLGTSAWSEYLDGDLIPRVDVHRADEVWPLKWHGSEVSECAFSSIQAEAGKKLIFIRLYRKDPSGAYRIENARLDYESGKAVALPEGIPAVVHTGISAPLFQIITPNLCNNLDTTVPMGLSIFANAIDALKGVDAVYDSLVSEYILGRKRLLIPASMVRIEQTRDGSMPIFDPNDLTFTAYQPSDEQPAEFHDLSPELRADAHVNGLRAALNVLSFKCGLGAGRYEFDRTAGVKTATEVVSEHSDLYQNLQRHELVLRPALVRLCQALLALVGRSPATEIAITFDDSVIQDRDAMRDKARDDVAAGLMSKYRYLKDVVGLSDDDAEAELARIRGESSVSADAIDFFNLKTATNAN